MSRFRVLHTPVTSAPYDFAICTANVPTPPDAPLIKTFCPGWTFPLSRRPCNAVIARNRTRSRLLKCYVGRLQRHSSSLADAHILSESPCASAEYFVTWFELRDVLADDLNCPCKINAQSRIRWFAKTYSQCTHDVWRTFNKVPIKRVNRKPRELLQAVDRLQEQVFQFPVT